jgi:predicted dehydrogenase
MSKLSRREILQAAGAASASMALPSMSFAEDPSTQANTMHGVPFEKYTTVKVGFIGIGGRGQGLLQDLLNTEGVQVLAICDIDPKRLAQAQARIKRANQPAAAEYGKTPTDYERLTKRGDLDLIYIASPWDWHVPMAVAAMKGGAHAAVEVPAAHTLKDCWKLVDTSEATRRHCIQLENCCYGYNELMVLNMVKDGLFGTLTHGEAAYIHDLRSLLLEDAGEGLWRRFPHTTRNSNLYPTHGLGPVAWYLGIHHGDRFETLVSLSSREASLTEFRDKTQKADSVKRKEKYICGDMNTSLIRTAKGRTVMLQHDVVTPRPYSRINMIQGSKGAFADYPERIFVEGAGEHDWASVEPYKKKYEHDLWRRMGDIARKTGGHGGMDLIMTFRLIECMRNGLAPDIDVYDAAAWSAPGPLSEASVKKGGAPQRFPDFTRGKWA